MTRRLGSETCRPGTSDPARRIEELGSRTPREAKELFLDPKKKEEVAQVLECGAVLGATLDSPYQTAIGFDDDAGKKLRVGVGHFTLTGAPKGQGFLHQTYRGMSGFCRTSERDGYCDETDYGAFSKDRSWCWVDKTLEEVDSKIKAAAYEMDPDHQKAKAFHGNLVFVAKDDRGAKDVEREIEDVVAEWSAHIDSYEAKLINDSRKLAGSTAT